MSPEQIRSGIDRLSPWFHAIDLGGGIWTKSVSVVGEPPDHPRQSWERILPLLPELRGREVLDVGCNGGFYAVEAKRRGAARVVAIDSQRHHVQQARFVRAALGLDIDVRRLSVYDLRPAAIGEFDVTLALGLIYHLKHLVLGLERLLSVTRGVLVVETGILPAGRFPEPFETPLGGVSSVLHPIAYVENAPSAKEASYNWFLPHPRTVAALLRSVGFTDVTVPWADDARAIVLARGAPPSGLRASGLRARIEILEYPAAVAPGADAHVRVRVTNEGTQGWPAAVDAPPGPVRLGATLLGTEDDGLDTDFGRAVLPHDVPPGEAVSLGITLKAPVQAGRYTVELDMVAEHLTWFDDLDSETARFELHVGPPGLPLEAAPPP